MEIRTGLNVQKPSEISEVVIDPKELRGTYAAQKLPRRFAFQLLAGGTATLAFLGKAEAISAKTQSFDDLLPEDAVNLQVIAPNEIPNFTRRTNLGHRLLTHNLSTESGTYQAALNPDLFDYLSTVEVPKGRPSIAITDPITAELADANLKLTVGASKLYIPSQEKTVYGLYASIGRADSDFYQVLQTRPLDLDEANSLNLLQIGWERSGLSILPGPSFSYAGGFDADMKDKNVFGNSPIVLPPGLRPR